VPTNPFEDQADSYLVLVNEEDQHSLWPARLSVPAGWSVTKNSAGRQECLNHIDENWSDLRPRSVRLAMRPQG
jgi:MbtH protein